MTAPEPTAAPAPNPFIEHPAEFNERGPIGGVQWRFEFRNGYGASVVRGPYTYGGSAGLWEIAVMLNGHVCYDTPITDDVIGHQTEDEIREILRAIAELPPLREVTR